MRVVPWTLLGGLAACEVPVDPEAPPVGNVISGTVTLTTGGAPSTTVVSARRPSSPSIFQGGELPRFATIPEAEFDSEAVGPVSSSFSLTRVPDGDWSLSALVDVDGNFSPFDPVAADATCGDLIGHYVDSVSGEAASVRVAGGQHQTGVAVIVSETFLTQRPVFSLLEPLVSLGGATGGPLPRFRVQADELCVQFSDRRPGSDVNRFGFEVDLQSRCTPDPSEICSATTPQCTCDLSTMSLCDTAVWMELRDEDGDGVVDPHPDPPARADMEIVDIWPRVALVHIPASEDGARGELWTAQAHPMAAEISASATALGIPAGEAAASFGPVGTPFPVAELSLTIDPVFRRFHAGGTAGVDEEKGPFDVVEAPSNEIPAGPWSVTLTSRNGQFWTVPNDGGSDEANSCATEDEVNARQAVSLILSP